MTAAELADLLDRLAPELDALAEPWCVIGSGALIIAGVDWPGCADLDILTTAAGAGVLEAAWKAWRQADDAADLQAPFRSRFSRYDFAPGAVEVMGDLDVRTAGGWTRLEVGAPARFKFGGRAWPAPDLRRQAEILRLFGRPKDMAKVAFLEGGGCAT